jgi:hypothetical protein
MLVKVILWLPLSIYHWVQSHFFPSTLFRYTYQPSSDEERERELYIRNKARLAAYYAKRSVNPR